jgi:hypothetical protein
MAQSSHLHRQARKVRPTLAICAAFRKNHGPALLRNLANSASRHLLLPWRTASRTGYNSIVLVALAIHQRHPIRNFNTHFPLSPLPVPPLIYPLHHPRQYHRALLREHHHHVSLCRCFMSVRILLLRSFRPSCLLPRWGHPARLPMPQREVMIHVI